MSGERIILERGEPGYEQARCNAIWNARRPARYPDAIVVARDQEDVVAAVELARQREQPLSVRSGGHSWIADAVRDGGVLVDLSALDAISVGKDAGAFSIQPAARSKDVAVALTASGMSFPTGHQPTVGLGGFILGGGYGWNGRTHGPACLSIEAVDVVLADGELVHADDRSDPRLMWAARGAGPGFFGVVTRFYLHGHEPYERILQSTFVFPRELRDDVLLWSYETLPSIPAQVEPMVSFRLDRQLGEMVVVLGAVAFLTHGTGPEVLDPIHACPFADRAIRSALARPTDFPGLYAGTEAATPEGLRYAVDGIWLDGPGAEIVRRARPLVDATPVDESFLLWMLWGHYPPSASACWSTQGRLYLSPSAGWSDPAEDLAHEYWTHALLGELQDLSLGAQLSDANPADRPDYGLSAENAARLEDLRKVYDPDGRFRSYMTPAESGTALGASRRRQR